MSEYSRLNSNYDSSSNLFKFQTLRHDLTQSLIEQSRRREEQLSLEQKISKIKAEFKFKFERLAAKVQQRDKQRATQTVISILKAYTKMRVAQHLEDKMVAFSK
jgi:hypothetical protein